MCWRSWKGCGSSTARRSRRTPSDPTGLFLLANWSNGRQSCNLALGFLCASRLWYGSSCGCQREDRCDGDGYADEMAE
eukprot:2058893-Heterocapsa_arctica.AAC.1